jgi:hypothetical protein
MVGRKNSVPEIEPGEVSIRVSAVSGNYQAICAEKVLVGVYAPAASELWTGGRLCSLRT